MSSCSFPTFRVRGCARSLTRHALGGQRLIHAISVSRDLSELDQLEAEHFDLRKNAERRGPILE
jgi:hypothetical protein